MNCEICGSNDVVVHIKQQIGNDTVQLHLCEKCANIKGIDIKQESSDLSISQLLTGLIDVKNEKKKNLTKKKCPRCGNSYTGLKKTGKLGCHECYMVFNKYIRSYLHRMYGKVRHNGKYPLRMHVYRNFVIDIQDLKNKLKNAIVQEDYETAAILRDKIKNLRDGVID